MALFNLGTTFNDPSKYGDQIAQTVREINKNQSLLEDAKANLGTIQAQIENKLSIYTGKQRKDAENGNPDILRLKRYASSAQGRIKDYEIQGKSYEKVLKGLKGAAAYAKSKSDWVAAQQNRNTAELQRNVDGRIDPVKGFPQEVSNIPLSDASNARLAGSRGRRKPAPLKGSRRRR